MHEVRGGKADLQADYRAAGFSARLGFGRSGALLVIDAVRAYSDPDSPLSIDAGEEIQSMVRLARAARAAQVPVFLVRMRAAAAGLGPSTLQQKVPAIALLLDGPTADFIPALAPTEQDVVIEKVGASAFFGTDLDRRLREASVDTCLIVGFSTSGCVRATAVDAVQHGFRPMVVADATADRADAPKESSLFDLDAKYADVVDEVAALEFLAGSVR